MPAHGLPMVKNTSGGKISAISNLSKAWLPVYLFLFLYRISHKGLETWGETAYSINPDHTRVVKLNLAISGYGCYSRPSITGEKTMTNPMQFLREVRGEMRKVTWPDWATTRQLTLMVFLLVILISLFLVLVDAISGSAIRALLAN